jgi:uncharacterized protein YcgI (DUF1989 family)
MQRLRIAGKSIVDFVAFNLNNFNERLDQVVARGVNGAKYSGQSRVLESDRRRFNSV